MPVVLGVVGLALAAAGTAVSVVSAREQAKAEEKAAKFNEQTALENARVAAQRASDESRQVRRRNMLVVGKQRAAAAKSGVLISGSVAELIQDSAVQGEMDRLAVLYSGALATGSFEREAALRRAEASAAARGSKYSAGGSLLSGLGRTASAASNPAFYPPKSAPPHQVD